MCFGHEELLNRTRAASTNSQNLKDEIGHIVDMCVFEVRDEFIIETMLTQIGRAILRDAGLDRPITVGVSFA